MNWKVRWELDSALTIIVSRLKSSEIAVTALCESQLNRKTQTYFLVGEDPEVLQFHLVLAVNTNLFARSLLFWYGRRTDVTLAQLIASSPELKGSGFGPSQSRLILQFSAGIALHYQRSSSSDEMFNWGLVCLFRKMLISHSTIQQEKAVSPSVLSNNLSDNNYPLIAWPFVGYCCVQIGYSICLSIHNDHLLQ